MPDIITDVNVPYTGLALKTLAESPTQPRQPLIEQLVYEKTVMMVYADPGAGKSIVSLCMALQASAGLPVFGFFEPVRPLKIYYALTERGIEEPLERIQLMKNAFEINYDNIYFDEGTIGINVLDQKDEDKLVQRIEKYCPWVDIIVFDPIYSMVRGGLSDPEDATLFAQFSARVQNHLKCANWFNHHTLKNTSDYVDGQFVQKNDPFMGSQFLKAHVTAMYHLTQRNNQPHFAWKKDSHGFLLKQFNLNYHGETQTVSMKLDTSEMTSKDKASTFLISCKKASKSFTFEQFFAAIQPCSLRYAQKILQEIITQNKIVNLNKKFESALYNVCI